MAKKKSKKDNSQDPQVIKEKIIIFLKSYKEKSFSLKQLSKKLNIKDKEELEDILERLVASGKLNRNKDGSYKAGKGGKPQEIITGKVDYVNPRFAYVVREDSEEDIWISTNKLHNALDGDLVKVTIFPSKDRRDRRPEGEVIEILERKRDQFVGRIEVSEKFAFVIPDSRKMHFDIFVPKDHIRKAKTGEKVIVKIMEWPGKDKNPVGEVIEVLGMAGNNDVEMHSIMAEFGLPYEFPERVVSDAEKIPVEISPKEISQRRDFRNITTFTIDPFDAKDFDDALSVRKTEKGNWEVGVHIADVTHYVKPETLLDKEAYDRATSVYLVDRVVPMLPEKLSNNLCSLRPHEDKLTFSAVFELNEDGKILNEWYGKTIIHSDRRFTYEEVQEIIEGGKGEFSQEIHKLNDLAHKLRRDRFKKGAIAFETVEVKFKMDEKGKPLAVIPKVRKDAHKLIEDFMLLANRKVAEFVHFMNNGKEKNTMVFRIHDHPNPEKISSLAIFAKKFGHKIDMESEDIANALNKLVEEVEGKPEQNVLQSLAIRTMAKAKYSTEPEIHFGLAYKHYTHFTSPIRRYPDMMAHRLLQHYLMGGKSANKEEYEKKCEHSSEMEKVASEAERASIKYKQVEFMQGMKAEQFEGIVSGVTEYGLFVEIIETKCEGMVRLSELQDDYYDFDAENYRVIGKRNKKIITLGDRVKVKVLKTDLEKRTIDLIFV
ncbi:MAG: ribonuclease R [Cytophagaceae bacterium]|nr:ribonuclease R [Cytophagaceae bacterium]